MAIIGRAKPAPASTTPAPSNCVACKATGTALHTVATDVHVCVAQAPCIARAKTAGIWKAS